MPPKHAALHSSKRMDWQTPTDFFDKLNHVYAFTLDAACSKSNALCDVHYDWPARDGLALSWAGHRVWCNPPYGRAIGLWTKKAAAEAHHAALIVMLVPARTDTVWWHEAVKTARPIFLKGRLKFKGAAHSAPFPSALLVWNA